MKFFLVQPTLKPCKGEINLLGDKSIAHRAVILSALSRGPTKIQSFPTNKDCLSTIQAFKKLGIKIKQAARLHTITVFGQGLLGLKQPAGGAIFTGESGTTLRLILGILAGQNFQVKLIAGDSLSRRPMSRVTRPLRMMGARINAILNTRCGAKRSLPEGEYSILKEEYPPLTIKGGKLKSITYKMPVASAQVKSAVLLAGLYASGITRVIEPIKTRDHTERMLKLFKAHIKVNGKNIVIKGGRELISPKIIYVPADISSASFFMVAAIILPGSKIRIKNVSLNPSRIGVVRALKSMGADIRCKVLGVRCKGYEPMGDIVVRSSKLKGAVIKKEEIPSLIDELPILMVAASLASGRTIFEGAGELRVKETDRIRSMSENLKKMGVAIKISKTKESENIIIQGVKGLKGARVRSFGDHRTAMSMVIAGLKAEGKTSIDDIACINKSFPEFLPTLKKAIT